MKGIASLKEKISYSFCAMVYEFECMMVMSYFILFCTDIMQIDVTVLGIVMVLAKILDAITDVLVLNLADRFNSPWGKYRPWILFSGIPLIVCLILIFWYPDFLHTETSKIVWMCLLYTLMVPVFETCFLCPMQVLGTVMSPDEGDRLDFAAFRTVGENFSDFFISAFCMTIILLCGGYRNVHSWRIMILIFAGIMLTALILGFTGIKERVVSSTTKEDGSNLTFFEKLHLLTGTGVFFRLLLSLTGMMISWMASIALFSYECINKLGHEEWLAPLSTIGILFQLASSIIISRLARKIDKRHFLRLGGALILISGLILMGTETWGGALCYQIVRGLGIGMVYVCIWASWPDVADYVCHKTGKMVPGIILAIVSLVMKLATALASYLVTTILDQGGYDGTALAQSSTTLASIHWGLVAVMVIGGFLILLGTIKSDALSTAHLRSYRENVKK